MSTEIINKVKQFIKDEDMHYSTSVYVVQGGKIQLEIIEGEWAKASQAFKKFVSLNDIVVVTFT